MNLAIESIIRDKSVQRLFRTPMTLGVRNSDAQHMWITLQTHDDEILVSHYDLDDFDAHNMDVETFVISREEVFKPKVVIPDGMKPITFVSNPVDTELNSYKKPMSQGDYENFHQEIFNPECHRRYKRSWLWANFAKRHGGGYSDNRSYINHCLQCDDVWELRYHCEDEMGYCALSGSPLWTLWERWSENLLLSEDAASGELVFASLFSSADT